MTGVQTCALPICRINTATQRNKNYFGEIVPLQFLKAVLPEPASLGPLTHGRTCIGCVLQGRQAGREKRMYVYNICSHEAAYEEVGSKKTRQLVMGLSASTKALAIASSLEEQEKILVITSSQNEAERLASDLISLLGEEKEIGRAHV